MNIIKGAARPKIFFREITERSDKGMAGELTQKLIFVISFFGILAYFIELNMGAIFQQQAFSPMKAAIQASIWAFCGFFLGGMITAVVGKLFNVNEKKTIIISCFFWAQTYGWIVGGLIAVILFLAIPSISGSPIAILIPIIAFIGIKAVYLFIAIKVSMQTSNTVSTFILGSSYLLTSTLTWCLSESVTFFFMET